MESIYENTKFILMEKVSITVRINRLVKIFIKTEDVEFKDVLQKLVNGLQYHVEPGSVLKPSSPYYHERPKTYEEWVPYITQIMSETLVFLDKRISSKKPEWQILAEKHGWAPKNTLKEDLRDDYTKQGYNWINIPL